MGGNLADIEEVLGGMLPVVQGMFTLVRRLAARQPVTQIAEAKYLVQRHGLAALAARAGDVTYREDLVRATVDWAQREKDVPPIVRALLDGAVRVAPIKGLAYAKSLYRHPADRPMADVDLLVPAEQVARARVVLGRLGFEKGATAVLHHAEPWTRGDLAVDLHWSIIAPGRSRIDLEALWSRTQPGWPEGAEHLSADDALVFHLVHLTRNRLRLPLINVVDAAWLLERADPDRAQAIAASWGLGTATALALRFCRAILAQTGDETPERPAGRLGPSHEEIVTLSEPSLTNKIMFDLAVAGSPTQIVSRVVHFGANTLRRRFARQ